MGTKILQAALALHERVSATFRKTAVNFHYEFTVGAPCCRGRLLEAAFVWGAGRHTWAGSRRCQVTCARSSP